MTTSAAAIIADRYRLEARLASGGMGETHRALDLRLNREVAVKLLHAHLASDPAFVRRLEREARIIAALSHPNIVCAYDHGMHDGRPFLVMELVDGESLASLLTRRETASDVTLPPHRDRTPGAPPAESPPPGALPLARTLSIARDLLSALAYGHERGLIHRDVKPANILLNLEGRAKLADFGIAQALDNSDAPGSIASAGDGAPGASGAPVLPDSSRGLLSYPTVTRPGEVLGSIHYLAPERLDGAPATPAVDVYATGVTLYRMLTGRLPFAGDLDAAVAAQHWRGAPTRFASLRPDLPEWLDTLVHTAIARDPHARYATARQMLRAFERGAAGATPRPSHDRTTALLTAFASQAIATRRATASATPGSTTLLPQAVRRSAPAGHLLTPAGRGKERSNPLLPTAAASGVPRRSAPPPRRLTRFAFAGVLGVLVALLGTAGAGATILRRPPANPPRAAAPAPAAATTSGATPAQSPAPSTPAPSTAASPTIVPTATAIPATATPAVTPSPPPPTATSLPPTRTAQPTTAPRSPAQQVRDLRLAIQNGTGGRARSKLEALDETLESLEERLARGNTRDAARAASAVRREVDARRRKGEIDRAFADQLLAQLSRLGL